MKTSITNHSSIKTKFAIKFLLAMKKLNNNNDDDNRSPSSKYKRFRSVRAAASASMASAVGPNRAWSLAVLRKVRRHRHQHLINKGRSRRRRSAGKLKKGNPRENLGFGQGEDLRCLVPGGEGMGFCSLLDETAHYVECLRAQVQVMKTILDHFSST